MRAVCVGGSYDRREFERHGNVMEGEAVALPTPISDSVFQGPGAEDGHTISTRPTSYEVYRLETFSYSVKNGALQRTSFWVHVLLEVDEAFALILNGYRLASTPAAREDASNVALRTLILANDMEDEARRLDAAFAEETDILTLASGAKSEQANALYVAADLVRQAHAKIKDVGI